MRKTRKLPSFLLRKLDKETKDANIRYLIGNGKFRNKNSIWKSLNHRGGRTRDNYIFKYDEYDDTIIALSKNSRLPCFKIVFDLQMKNLSIDISYYSDCAYNELLPSTIGTQVMLKVVFELITKNKHFNEYNRISISDNSSIKQSRSKNEEYYIILADMYFITSGCTWYSSLAPMFLQNRRDDLKFIEDRKKIIGENSISWDNLIQKVPPPVSDFLISNITIDKNISKMPGTAYRVLKKIRELKKYSIIFHEFHDVFLSAFNIDSLFEKEWSIALDNGKVLAPHGDTIIQQCKNAKGWLIPDIFIKYVSNEDYESIKEGLQTPLQKEIDIGKIKIDKITIDL